MNDHTVWYVYDELRTAKLSLYYYSCLLGRRRRWHRIREFIMAASGSTGVAGMWFLATPAGSVMAKSLASLSAVLAVYHTVTHPSESIRELEAEVTTWAQLERSLADVRRRIHEAGRYEETIQREVKDLLEKNIPKFIDTNPDEKLRARFFEQVKRELPAEGFFVPEI